MQKVSISEFTPTNRTKVKRLPERGVYERETIYSILDEGLVCHIGFEVQGQPYVIPTGYCRVEDMLFIHGSAASRMLKTLKGGVPVCFTVTLLDGLVVARSGFHSSMNYRSVVVLGKATEVTGQAEKLAAMQALVEHIIPGRWDDLRPVTDKEIKATLIQALPIEEASAKLRTGMPKEDEEDYDLPIWGGVVPLVTRAESPLSDAHNLAGVEVPGYITEYRRPN